MAANSPRREAPRDAWDVHEPVGTEMGRHSVDEERRKMVRVYPMPARIKCPAPGCGMEQVLDPVVLRYSTIWRPTPVTLLDKQVDAGPALVTVPREIAEEKGF